MLGGLPFQYLLLPFPRRPWASGKGFVRTRLGNRIDGFFRKEATVKVADKRAGGAAGRPVESAIRLFFYVITIGYSIWERIKISVPLKLFMCFATDAL
jgi:hypothetical protein